MIAKESCSRQFLSTIFKLKAEIQLVGANTSEITTGNSIQSLRMESNRFAYQGYCILVELSLVVSKAFQLKKTRKLFFISSERERNFHSLMKLNRSSNIHPENVLDS